MTSGLGTWAGVRVLLLHMNEELVRRRSVRLLLQLASHGGELLEDVGDVLTGLSRDVRVLEVASPDENEVLSALFTHSGALLAVAHVPRNDERVLRRHLWRRLFQKLITP